MVVFEDNKLVKLLEIKCPYAGKTSNIYDIVRIYDIVVDKKNIL